MRNKEKQTHCPMWILELRYMVESKMPLFSSLLLEEDGAARWKQDAELSEFVRRGWVEIVADGFVITARGRRVYEREWDAIQGQIRRRH